jgi:hypothetical protein
MPGELKLGNQDVKEVYLGTEKIWPSKIIYPDPVDRFFWKVYGGIDGNAIGLFPSCTVALTQKGNRPSGALPNIDNSKATMLKSTQTDRRFTFEQQSWKADETQRLYMQNQKGRLTFDMKKWTLQDTDYNCKLKIVMDERPRFDGSGATYAEHYWSSSSVRCRFLIEDRLLMLATCSYPSAGQWIERIDWFGTLGYAKTMWVSNKTIAEYMEQDNGILTMDQEWAVNENGTDAASTRYAWQDVGKYLLFSMNFMEFSFTTEEPDIENPDFHRCFNPRHVGNMKADQPVFRDNYRITIGSVNNTVRIWEFVTSPSEYLTKAPYVGFGHLEGNRDNLNRFYFWGFGSGTDANQLALQLNNDDLNELHVNGVSINIDDIALRGAWKAFQGSVLGGGVAWGVYVDIPNTLSAVWDAEYQGVNFVGLTP